MYKILLVLAVLFLSGCFDENAQKQTMYNTEYITIVHDNLPNNSILLKIQDPKSPVTCYTLIGYRKGGLSCIPDTQIPSLDDCIPSSIVDGNDGMPGSCTTYRMINTKYR